MGPHGPELASAFSLSWDFRWANVRGDLYCCDCSHFDFDGSPRWFWSRWPWPPMLCARVRASGKGFLFKKMEFGQTYTGKTESESTPIDGLEFVLKLIHDGRRLIFSRENALLKFNEFFGIFMIFCTKQLGHLYPAGAVVSGNWRARASKQPQWNRCRHLSLMVSLAFNGS